MARARGHVARGEGRRLSLRFPRGGFSAPMATDDASIPTPYLIPVDHATLRPCPQCGARQWRQGVTYYPVHALWVSGRADTRGAAGAATRDRMITGGPMPHAPSSALCRSALPGGVACREQAWSFPMATPAGGRGPGRVTRSLAPVPRSGRGDDQPGWGLASRSHWSMRACRALGGDVLAWSCSSWATTAAGRVA